MAHPSKLAGLSASDRQARPFGRCMAHTLPGLPRCIPRQRLVAWKRGGSVCLSVPAEPARLSLSTSKRTEHTYEAFPNTVKHLELECLPPCCPRKFFAGVDDDEPTAMAHAHTSGTVEVQISQSIPSIARPRNLGSQSGSTRICCGQMGPRRGLFGAMGKWRKMGMEMVKCARPENGLRSSNVTLQRHSAAVQHLDLGPRFQVSSCLCKHRTNR